MPGQSGVQPLLLLFAARDEVAYCERRDDVRERCYLLNGGADGTEAGVEPVAEHDARDNAPHEVEALADAWDEIARAADEVHDDARR